MITIPIKIAREDKAVMVQALEALETYPLDLEDLNRIIVYEIYTEIQSKLRSSQHNDKPIRLNLAQTQGFLTYINQVYAKIGSYEMANTIALNEKIRKEIHKKAITLTY